MDLMPNAEQMKQAARVQWDDSAQGWNDYTQQIRDWLGPITEAMLDAAQVRAGAHVLDVAAGAGDQTLAAAARVGAGGRVVATDISPGILAFVGANAARAGFANVETKVADGEQIDVGEGVFDAVICRLGLMFFPDPVKGLDVMRRALKPGGRAAVIVFSTPERNACMVASMQTAFKHAGKPAPDPYRTGGIFSLGKPGLIKEVFEAAGFREVKTQTFSAPFRMPSAEDYLGFLRAAAGAVRQIVAGLDPVAQTAVWAEMGERMHAFDTVTGWEGPNELILASGVR